MGFSIAKEEKKLQDRWKSVDETLKDFIERAKRIAAQQETGSRSKRHPESDEGEGSRGEGG